MRPPRLVIVTRRFWPLVGGTEKSLGRLAAGLAAAGCPTTVLTARWQTYWPAEIRFHDVPVVRLAPAPESCWTKWQYARRLGRWLRSHAGEFDLVYVAGLKHEAYVAMRAVGRRLPVVLRPERAGRYGDCFWQLEARGGRRIKNACLKAAAFAAPTPAIRRDLEAAGYPRTRIHDVPLGVPLPPARTPQSQAEARAVLAEAHPALELPPGTTLAMYAGRLEEGRGLESLLAAWSAVGRRRPAARLWLAGEGPAQAALRRRIEALGLSNRALLVGVFDESDTLLAAADLAVAPSPEGSPVALLEAMAAGLPVVAADAVANHPWVSDGRDGLLVRREDTAALEGALARLLDEPEWAARLGAAARQRAAAFSLARMVEEHLTLFETITTH